VTFASTQHLASLSLAASTNVTLSAGGNKVLSAVAVSSAGRLDLKDNKLITRTAVGTWTGSSYSGVTGMIESGINLGGTLWAGSGITTSLGGNGATSFTALGVILNDYASLGQTSGPIYTSFGGESVGVNDVLVKYTYFGDADLNGQVNSNDYFQIDTGFLAHRTGWINGDFDYSGSINSNDYFLIDRAFLGQTAALTPATGGMGGVSSVPEPAGLGFVALLGVGCAGQRRCRRPASRARG
jgi:hypothetical protein